MYSHINIRQLIVYNTFMNCLLRPHLFYIAVLRGKNVITQVYTILFFIINHDNQKITAILHHYTMSLMHKSYYTMYLNMIILYNTSPDWSRESRDRANKTSCLPGNKYRVSPLRKSRDFSLQR